MKITPFLFATVALVLCLPSLPANAAEGCVKTRDGSVICPEPDSRCVTDIHGEVVCSTPGGGIDFDRYGVPQCGPGYCVKDQHGDLFCSSAARGAAAKDRYGKATCAVSCVPASAQACIKPQPAK